MTEETGTLGQLNVQPGDVVEYTAIGEPLHSPHTFTFQCWHDGEPYSMSQKVGGGAHLRTDTGAIFRIVSRASDAPKTWGEMTDAEKGALLLAAHEGKVIQVLCWDHDGEGWNAKPTAIWNPDRTYRVRPEPKRKTVTLYTSKPGEEYGNERKPDDTHAITYDLIDGKPDWSTLKGEDL